MLMLHPNITDVFHLKNKISQLSSESINVSVVTVLEAAIGVDKYYSISIQQT